MATDTSTTLKWVEGLSGSPGPTRSLQPVFDRKHPESRGTCDPGSIRAPDVRQTRQDDDGLTDAVPGRTGSGTGAGRPEGLPPLVRDPVDAGVTLGVPGAPDEVTVAPPFGPTGVHVPVVPVIGRVTPATSNPPPAPDPAQGPSSGLGSHKVTSTSAGPVRPTQGQYQPGTLQRPYRSLVVPRWVVPP